MSVAELPIQIDRERIAAFCRERGIRRLSLFGSVLRDDFDAAHSDVDVLAEYEPGALKGLGWDIIDHREALSELLGRTVDYCTRLHPLVAARVQNQLFPIYERS
jgi:predicted nucleotidyltransferase